MNYAPPIPRLGVAAITENLLKRKWSATILRYIAKGVSEPGPENAETWLAELRTAAAGTPQASKQAMKRLVPEYTPFTE